MKKVFLSSMMVMFMIAGSCGCVQAQGSWENKVLKQRKAIYTYHGKCYKMKDYPYYKVLDINHEGINELLIANQKQDKGGIMNTAPCICRTNRCALNAMTGLYNSAKMVR